MTLKQLETYFIDELIPVYGSDEAAQLFYLTAEHISGLNRSELILKNDFQLDAKTEDAYKNTLSALTEGKPLQHIFEEAWFYGLKFRVTSSVLIPRPETEELVHWILETASGFPFSHLLDVGTGTGCIAITLQKKLDSVKAEAMDISSDALMIAKENAVANEADIAFIQADILGYEGIKSYDLIVSNPPYITPKERQEMHHNVLGYEPELALFVTEENPLIFYKSIADFAVRHLDGRGFLFFEINEYLGKEMIEMLEDKGFANIHLKKDMQGKDRMIRCNKAQ